MAYRQLENYILQGSSAATTWTGSVPPMTTGWVSGWTDRGVRARYCGDVLLVYMGPGRLKGVGTDQRSVRAASMLYAGGQRGGLGVLHWLEGGVAEGGSGRASVTLPPCLSGAGFGPLPSGRVALAGEVRDPYTTTRPRSRWEFREIAGCPAGFHRPKALVTARPARKERRRLTQEINGKGQWVGTPVHGPWEALYNLCNADYTTVQTETRPCTFVGGPGGVPLPGFELWRRERTVTQNAAGETVDTGVWQSRRRCRSGCVFVSCRLVCGFSRGQGCDA